jgi:hypothetical protein
VPECKKALIFHSRTPSLLQGSTLRLWIYRLTAEPGFNSSTRVPGTNFPSTPGPTVVSARTPHQRDD